MSNKAEVIKPTLTHAARKTVTTAVCDALSSKENTGSIVTLVCNAARAIMKGKPFPVADMAAICEDVAIARGWKGKSKPVRMSEVKTLLCSYAKLPEAIKLAQARGPCNWHMAMKMARVIKDGKSVQTAVTEASRKKKKAPRDQFERLTDAMRKLYKESKGKRKALLQAWEILGCEGDIA